MGIPVVRKRIVGQQWQIMYYAEFESVLFQGERPRDELAELVRFAEKGTAPGLRREITLDAFPFLCAVRPEEKAIYVGTRRLSRELALLKLYEASSAGIDGAVEKQLFH